MIRILLGGLLAAMLLGSTQCQNNNNGVGPDGPVFVTTLAVEDASGNVASSFLQGQAIQLVLSVRNRSNSVQTLSFNTSQNTNFVVLNSGSATEVWTWSLGQQFPQTATSLTFQPGQTQTVTVTWNQTNDSGQAVASGSYEVFGGLTCVNSSNSSSSSSSSASTACMATGIPTSDQLAPSVYISTLAPFTIQ